MTVPKITQVPNLSRITEGNGLLMASWARFFNDAYQLLTGLSTTVLPGDASQVAVPTLFHQTYVWNSPLTAGRTLSISGGFPTVGMRMRAVRTNAATGASTLTTTGSNMANITIPKGQWADFEYVAGFWYETAAGTLL